MAEKWIQKANIKKGALTKQAARSGKTVSEYIQNPPKNITSTTRRRISLAKTFNKIRPGVRRRTT